MPAIYGKFMTSIWGRIQHFNYDKYWDMREYICSSKSGLKRYLYLYRLKRMDSYNNASLGTHINFKCATFETRPILPHGIKGIIISNEAIIGKNCTIFHHVTIGGGEGGSPTIGNNVFIGAGAKIVGKVKIGDNAKIGAGCVVAIDIPDNCTVVMQKPRIIFQSN